MNRDFLPRVFPVFLVLMAGTVASSAAVIQWGAPRVISGDSDVSTSGTPVEAYNINGGAVTLNGVSFASFLPPASPNPTSSIPAAPVTIGNATFLSTTTANATYSYRTTFGSATGAFATLSADYQSLLGTGILANTSSGTPVNQAFTFTFGNLIVGQPYEVQIWGNDSRNSSGTQRRMILNGSGGPTVDFNDTQLSGGVGQWILGTFIADAATQSFTAMNPTSTAISPQLNAFQLRAVPEPSLALIAGLSLLTLAGRRRNICV